MYKIESAYRGIKRGRFDRGDVAVAFHTPLHSFLRSSLPYKRRELGKFKQTVYSLWLLGLAEFSEGEGVWLIG